MAENEQKSNETISPVKMVWDAAQRALTDGIIGVKTKPIHDTSIVADIIEGEVYATRDILGGNLDIGTLDGRFGDPQKEESGLTQNPTQAKGSVNRGNILGARFSDDDIFMMKGQPVAFEGTAGLRHGDPVIRGILTSGFKLSTRGMLSYGMEISADGKDGVRGDAFAQYRHEFTPERVGHITAHTSAQAFGSNSRFTAALTGRLDQKITGQMSILANAHLSGSPEHVHSGADVGLYRNVHGGMRVGGYVGADTDRGVKAGIAVVQPFGL